MATADADYRAFFLNENGRITSAAEIAAPDDATAFAKAKVLLTSHQQAELWQEKRRLGIVQASFGAPDASRL